MAENKGRPDTFAGCLLTLAEWLDASDEYIRTFGPAGAAGFGQSDVAQQDLRRLAANLPADLDARLMEIMDDSILPLDPEPWAWWNGYCEFGPRRAIGPMNDGDPHPHGTLSELRPRKGYRQDIAAYAHTRREGLYEVCDDPEHDHPTEVSDGDA